VKRRRVDARDAAVALDDKVAAAGIGEVDPPVRADRDGGAGMRERRGGREDQRRDDY